MSGVKPEVLFPKYDMMNLSKTKAAGTLKAQSSSLFGQLAKEDVGLRARSHP
jgi:hypothetical protein